MNRSTNPTPEEGIQIEIDGQKGFAVVPKTDCPHCLDSMIEHLDNAITSLNSLLVTSPCRECADNSECWFCLVCENVFCSRYVKAHMSTHYDEMKHAVAFSLADGSFWCYICNSYIINQQMTYLQTRYSAIKFTDSDE